MCKLSIIVVISASLMIYGSFYGALADPKPNPQFYAISPNMFVPIANSPEPEGKLFGLGLINSISNQRTIKQQIMILQKEVNDAEGDIKILQTQILTLMMKVAALEAEASRTTTTPTPIG